MKGFYYCVSDDERLLVRLNMDTGELLYISPNYDDWNPISVAVEGMFFRGSLDGVSEEEAKVIFEKIKEIT